MCTVQCKCNRLEEVGPQPHAMLARAQLHAMLARAQLHVMLARAQLHVMLARVNYMPC